MNLTEALRTKLTGTTEDEAQQKKIDDLLATRRGRRAVDRWTRAQLPKGQPHTARTIRPSAREWFPYLVDRLMASRPIIGETKAGLPVFGAPTFRNRIDEHGHHV